MTTMIQDKETVKPDGESTQRLPVGVTFHDVITQVDDRGTVCGEAAKRRHGDEEVY
jgi:hypothetical protein